MFTFESLTGFKKEVDWRLTLVAIFATFNYFLLKVYAPVISRYTSRKINKVAAQFDLLQLLCFPIETSWHRCKSITKLLPSLLICNLFLLIGVTLLGLYFEFMSTLVATVSPATIGWSSVIFVALEVVLQCVLFLDEALFSRLDIIVDRTKLFVSLLRLSNRQSH